MNTIARTSSPKYPNLAAVPPSYRALCEEWLPRPIHDAATNEEATSMIDALAGFSLNREQEDYLEAVSHFVSDYEGDYLPQVSGLELLRLLTEENRLSGTALSEILGGSRLLGAMILRGERRITADHARSLGAHFAVDPGAFL